MPLPILYHNDLKIKDLEKEFSKTLKQLQTGDFNSADVRKMAGTGYYRARLNIRDRLLFSLVRYEGAMHLLLLDVILNHNYAGSRFLRGAMIPADDQLQPLFSPDDSQAVVENLTYLNPKTRKVHTLNKFISFDDLQQSVLHIAPPLIVIGSAGSGKTALVLEKLKDLPGNVAYISLSHFLVENASKIYYSNGYDNEHQDVEFLSLNDYLAGWEKPEGREVDFRRFEPWFTRYAQAVKINEPYRVFEEFKGVITGSPTHTAWLSEKEYLELGVKQSIFSVEERKRLYPLFGKYLDWLKESDLYDSNILCYQYLEKIKPQYNYVVVDEVQDITNIQLRCILQSLVHKTHFILTGDSNQIVHPNFFSWSKVKTYFYETGDCDKQIQILQTNYRNSLQVVELSNNLLKIKNRRFGSIDRESNYLVDTVNKAQGEVVLYPDDEKKKKELNRRTQDSTRYAVIVPDNRHKGEARRHFKTPLVFSVQEAKGLEYENVILVNFVSDNEAEFREIINGVTAEDLRKEELRYNRAGDKHDKDAEIYKFYINSFYVAITRAVKNIYLFEKSVHHPALQLLQMKETQNDIRIAEAKSTREEWLAEAQRLEEQGKTEQAEQIRAKYLGYEYISAEQLEEIKRLALDPAKKEAEVKKERKQLFQYAVNHQRYDWVEQLATLQFARAVLYMKEIREQRKEYSKNIRLGRTKEAMATVKKFSIDFTCDDGETGLMLALYHGQDALAGELMALHANPGIRDNKGSTACDYLLKSYLTGARQKQTHLLAGNETLVRFWPLVRPSVLVYEAGKRQLRVNGHSMVFFLLTLMRTMEEEQLAIRKAEWDKVFKTVRMVHGNNIPKKVMSDLGLNNEPAASFNMPEMEAYAEWVPDEVLPPYRKKRQYINSVLSGNEISRAEMPNCKLAFKREGRGVYVVNPEIFISLNENV